MSLGTVLNILRKSLTYAGYIRFSGEWYEGNHPAVITVEQAKEAQKIVKARARGAMRGPYVYSGLVTCGPCNAPMYSRTDFKRAKGRQRIYKCSNCHKSITEVKIHEALFDFLNEYKDSLLDIDDTGEPFDSLESDIALLQDELEGFTKAYFRADESFAMHGDRKRYMALLEKLDAEKERVEERLDKLLEARPKSLVEKLEIIDYLLMEVLEGDPRMVNKQLREHFHFIKMEDRSIQLQCSLT